MISRHSIMIQMRFWLLPVVLLGMITAMAANLRALAAKEAQLSSAEKAAVQKVTAYFNKFKNIQGEFVQVGPRGHLSEGKFYMSRPGRLRFEYMPPNPFLVVSDGRYVIIHDRRLKTADHIPLSATPLRIVLAKKVDILHEAKIIRLNEDADTLSLTLEDKGQLVAGQLTLVFNNRKFALDQWVIIDGQGNKTTISVKRIQEGIKPDPALFKVELPKNIENSIR